MTDGLDLKGQLTGQLDLEKEAARRSLSFLQMGSSLTAGLLYKARGYEVQGRGEHVLSSGQRMARVQMRKQLAASLQF